MSSRRAFQSLLILAIVSLLFACKRSEPTHLENRRPDHNVLKEYIEVPMDKANAAAKAVEDRDDQIKRQLEEFGQ